MEATLTCPYCFTDVKKINMRGGVAGQTVHCSSCGRQFKYSYRPGATKPTIQKI